MFLVILLSFLNLFSSNDFKLIVLTTHPHPLILLEYYHNLYFISDLSKLSNRPLLQWMDQNNIYNQFYIHFTFTTAFLSCKQMFSNKNGSNNSSHHYGFLPLFLFVLICNLSKFDFQVKLYCSFLSFPIHLSNLT